jgi:hypothetical protein
MWDPEGLFVMMWSWRIGRITGIDLYFHPTFVLLLAWVAISHYLQRLHWMDAVSGLVFIVTLFGIVVLHELGHAWNPRAASDDHEFRGLTRGELPVC